MDVYEIRNYISCSEYGDYQTKTSYCQCGIKRRGHVVKPLPSSQDGSVYYINSSNRMEDPPRPK